MKETTTHRRRAVPAAAPTRLVLLAHGSRDVRWRAPFEMLLAGLRRDLADAVDLAYMEFAAPTLDDSVEAAVAAGVRRIRLLPLFLAAGAHVSSDVPELVAQARRRHPELGIDVLPPIGEDPRFAALLASLIREHAEAVPGVGNVRGAGR